jgi:hypothetical protein
LHSKVHPLPQRSFYLSRGSIRGSHYSSTWGFIDRVVAHSDDHVRARGREVALRDEFGRLDALILNASGGLERGAYPASGATSG